MAQLFTNNATSTLASGINDSTTSISLAAGTGSRFPSPTGGDYFYLTLFQRSGGTEINHEIVKVTARSTDTLTVTRAQEGTTAKSFNTSDPVELRLTTGFLKDAALSGTLTTSSSTLVTNLNADLLDGSHASAFQTASQDLTDIVALAGTDGFLKKVSDVWTLDTATYLTSVNWASPGTIGSTTPNTGSFTSLTASGNLTFTGTGNRILGDFSNATVANRVLFQTSTTNGNTSVAAIPNGTGSVANFRVYNNSDTANSSFTTLSVEANSDSRITSGILGTGTYLPLTFYTGGSERVRIDSSGNVGIGVTPSYKLHVNGSVYISDSSNGFDAFTINDSSSNSIAIRLQNTFAGSRNWNVGVSGGGPAANGSFVIYDDTVGATRMAIDSSGNVGIGTTAPVYKLVVNNATTYSSVSGQTASSTVAHLTSEAACNFWLDSYTTGNPGIIGRKANGSSTTPSATLANNVLLAITGRGYGATGWGSVGVASISIAAAENFTDTAQGTNISIETTPTGSTTRAERLRIDSSGNVTFKNGIIETVFTITDAAAFEINPTNGTMQLITLGANRTPKATSFAAGQSVTLMVLDGTAYTLTWTDATFGGSGVVWVGGSAPTLDTTKYTVIELWKVGTQVYGALVGAA